ncbi:MAG: hypothetical protein EOP07_06845 [Proteobacteria bacterium]|nr:MAG: hypothetical protein EOP07_06845 [Pseudomonadota bacterium]
MKSVAEQFEELVATRKPSPKKFEMGLADAAKIRADKISTEEWAAILKSDLALFEEVALELREKLGSASSIELCKVFSDSIRKTVRIIKEEIKIQGRPSFELDKALDRGVSEQLTETMARIKRAG